MSHTVRYPRRRGSRSRNVSRNANGPPTAPAQRLGAPLLSCKRRVAFGATSLGAGLALALGRRHFTTGGGLGGSFRFCTHDERSNKRNAIAFSWAESSAFVQPLGKGAVTSAAALAT